MSILNRILNLISFNMADCVIGSTPPQKKPENSSTIILTDDEYGALMGCGQTNCKEAPNSNIPGRLWNIKFTFKNTWDGVNRNTGGSCPIPTVDQVPMTLINYDDLVGNCQTVATLHITTGGKWFFYISNMNAQPTNSTGGDGCREELKKQGEKST